MKRSLSRKNKRNAPATPRSQASVATVRKMDTKGIQSPTEHSDSPPAKKMKMNNSVVASSPVEPSYSFTSLSLEVLCQIMQHLSLKEVMRLQSLSHKFHEAVSLHLRLLTSIDFTEGQIYGWMPTTFTDTTFKIFINRCPDLKYIYGLHNEMLARRRQRGQDILSIPGIIEVLSACPKLEGVETSDIFLLEAFLTYMPRLQILRPFRNRDSGFPIPPNNRFQLTQNPQITTLHLTGVVIPELPRMDHLKHLHLRWVRLTHAHPFRDFVVPQLCSFVMSNCAGPTNALKYVPLITGLAAARSLNRIELVRVPFLGGLIQHVVEDSWRMNGFRNISKIVLGSCKHALEVDLGYLAITCANRLSELSVQPSLTKDSFFASLSMADVSFPTIESVHLGFVDDFPEQGKWTNEQLVTHGLADVTDSPAMITDIGLKAVGKAFPSIRNLSIYNCPHLHFPNLWFDFDVPLAVAPVMNWTRLRELHLRRCHAIRLQDLCRMIPMLPCLESLILEQMFREPPKGCSRVGLSAGTGLGVSAALVQNTGNDAANQDLANNNPPGPPPNPVGANNQVPPNGAAGAQQAGVIPGPADPNEAAGGAQEADIADNLGVQPAAAAGENDDNDIIDEELDDGDMWEAADFEMHCSCCGAQLDDPRQTQSDDGNDSRKNSSSSANGEKNSETVSDGTSPQAGPSGLQEPRPSSSCSHSSGRSCHRNCHRSKTTSDNIGSGRVLRSKSSRKCAARILDSPHKPEDTPTTSKSNGKSLRGNKKGLVKKSTSSSNQVHQACQASSDEIRETTKKKKVPTATLR